VRGADHAHVDCDLLAPAEPLDRTLLQEAQQLGLQRARQVADLVEEQRALVRRLDLADGLLRRAGEGALLVAEQLALEKRLGMAAQLMATKRCDRRGDSSCTPRASNSLPVPESPRIITVALVGATRSIVRQARSISGSRVISPARPSGGCAARRRGSLLQVVQAEGAVDHQRQHVGLEGLA